MDTAIVFERGDKVYLVGPVAPIEPKPNELEEFAFADVIRDEAPSELLLWLRGQYVEADLPNLNGQIWSSEELAIKSLSPKLMPVSVMHNPTQTVGLIADTRLLTPDVNQVPRSRIDTALAVWKHRYPDVCEEAVYNYRQGTLMQSMECLPSWYECVECGKAFPKLPHGAEAANWCSHLKAGAIETAAAITRAPRRLGDVTFTGTGLIFGSRGATGAFEKAHLDTLAEEVAEFHGRAQTEKPTRRKRRMETIEIPRNEYDELKSAAAKNGELTQRITGLEEAAAKVPDLEKQVDELEIGKKKAEDDLASERTTREGLEEQARARALSSERLAKLGDPFKAKLPDSVKTRLEEQAKTMSDEDWTDRLEELAAMTGVKPDEQSEGGQGSGNGGSDAGTFTREETARANLGGGNGSGAQEPSRVAVSTVLGGLFEQTRPQRREPAQK
jgi:hypothetical protein